MKGTNSSTLSPTCKFLVIEHASTMESKCHFGTFPFTPGVQHNKHVAFTFYVLFIHKNTTT